MKQVEDESELSLQRILAILELLARHDAALTATGVASALRMRRTEVTRLLVMLDARHLVLRDRTCAYALTPLGRELAQALDTQVNVVACARPFLEELAQRVGEAVCLSVLLDDKVVVLDVAEIYRRGTRFSLVGKCCPSLATTAGRAMRALQSRDLLEKLFRRKRKLVRKAEQERLFEELDLIRSKGVAIDVGSLEAGMGSVAAAVRDYAGKVVCALTVVGPSFRMVTDRIEKEIVPSLTAVAEHLSMKFGYAKGGR